MKKLFLTAILISISFAIQAQNTVVGTLLDERNRTTIPYANCVLLSVTDSHFVHGVISDDNGRFTFKNVANGDYLLRISMVAYESYYKHIHLPTDADLGQINITQSTILNEVTVTAERPLYSADGEKLFYHVDEDPSIQTGTAINALQNAPGVEVDAAGNISLRGSTAVEIWINDQPSHLEGEAIKQYLKTTPASNIKRIEVLNNPSARYGSSSNAIINIITEQKMVRNELLCLGLNLSSQPSIAPWLSYVWANEKVSINTWLSTFTARFNIDVENHEEYHDATGALSTKYGYKGGEKQTHVNGGLGTNVNWQISNNSSLSIWVAGYIGKSTQEAEYNILRTEHLYSPGNYNYLSLNNNPTNSNGAFGGIYFSHTFDTLGQKINVSFNSTYNGNTTTYSKERVYEVQHQLDMLHKRESLTPSFWNNLDITYIKPYSSTGHIETGGGIEIGRNNTHNYYDTLDYTTNSMEQDASRTFSNSVLDNEISAFITIQQQINKLVLKGGLRGYRKWKQAYMTDLPVETTQYDVDKDFWDFIPSIHASYSLNSGHNFTLSYTRRFMSPGATLWSTYEQLNEDSYSVGNPDLKFSHTHNLEGGWGWYQTWGSLGINGYLRANTNEISSLHDVAYHPYFGRIVSFSQYQNIGSSSTTGAEANITLRPKPFINIRMYANVYNYHYNFEYRPNEWIDTGMVSVSARINTNARIWNRETAKNSTKLKWIDYIEVFANANYNGKRLTLMSTDKPSFQLDIGLSSELLNHRLSIYAIISDVLHTQRSGSKSFNPYYQTNYSYSYNSQTFSVGLVWRIGKLELESMAKQGSESH